MNTMAINDIQVSFVESDGGQPNPPVVLIHGLAEDKSSWAHIQHKLVDLHTYAYDLRGHGETTVGAADGSLAQLGRDLIGFLEAVTGPACVVGFSLGGTIALWAAAERPDLVTQAVVLGTSSVVGRGAAEFYEHRIAQAADTAAAEFRAAVRDDTAAGIAVAHDRLDAVTATRLAAIGGGAGYVNAARAMAALRAAPLTPRLGAITAHVDVIGADSDAFCPKKAAQIIIDALADVSYREIPDAGHLMNIDNPDAVADALRASIIGRN